MMKHWMYLWACCALYCATACKIDLSTHCKQGNGQTQTQTRTLPPFTRIEVTDGLQVEVAQGNTPQADLTLDSNLLSHILTDVKEGKLIVSTDECIDPKGSSKIVISLPLLQSVQTNGGSQAKIGQGFGGALLELESSSGSQLNTATLEYDHIKVKTSSGASATVRGQSLKVQLNSSSGSQLDADELMANEVQAEASSGSSLSAQAIVSMAAKASSGASIRYLGQPKNVTQDSSSGGSIQGHDGR